MHRNTFINSPKLLDETYNLKKNNNIYFAGQITGVEGYVESIASGLVAGLNAIEKYKTLKNDNNKYNKQDEKIKEKYENANNTDTCKEKRNKIIFPEDTIIGALAKYISSPNDNFQPMNANFGILPELPEKIKDKKIKYGKLADRAIEHLNNMLRNITII